MDVVALAIHALPFAACTPIQKAGISLRWSPTGPLPLLAIGLLLRMFASRISDAVARRVRRRP